MPNATEITPGVCVMDGKLHVCPGCGLEDIGLDPFDSDCVFDWCKATFAALSDLGMQGVTQEEAEAIAAHYMREPWHGVQ